jgi:hypothetical protein
MQLKISRYVYGDGQELRKSCLVCDDQLKDVGCISFRRIVTRHARER